MDYIYVVDQRERDWFWLENEIFEVGLRPSSFVVFAYLAMVSDYEDIPEIPVKKLAKALRMDERTVKQALRELTQKGLIVRKRTRKGTVISFPSTDNWERREER